MKNVLHGIHKHLNILLTILQGMDLVQDNASAHTLLDFLQLEQDAAWS